MALTATQKTQVRMYLGYSDGSRSAPSNYNLEGAMLALSAEAETLVGTILTSLATIDASMTSVSAAARAGIIEVDNGGVKWESGRSAGQAVSTQGRMLTGRLARILGVPVWSDAFGSGVSSSGVCGLA